MTIKITAQLAAIVLGAFSGILIPGLLMMVRSAVKWTRLELKVEEVVTDVRELVENKDRVHAAIIEQMKCDREVSDRRLRWLEEHLWKRLGNAVRNPGER